MKKIISLFLTLVLCVGLFAALGVSAFADEEEIRSVTISPTAASVTVGDVEVNGTLYPYSPQWMLADTDAFFDLTISVPKDSVLKRVVITVDYLDRLPGISSGRIVEGENGRYTLSIYPSDAGDTNTLTLHGVATRSGKPVTVKNQLMMHVKLMIVEYTAPHTHQKNDSDYHAAVAPTCGKDGNVEYWGCTNPGCNVKLDANGNVIADITVPATGEHSLGDYSVTIPATCSATGIETAYCSICGATVTREIPKDPNVHIFPTAWSYDSNNHWHAAACGHDVKADVAEHSWKGGGWFSAAKCEICGAQKGYGSGSTLSEGNGVIVGVIAAAAVVALGAIVIGKKKKSEE